MIRLPDVPLPGATAAALAAYQAEVDASGDYAARVIAAAQLFKSRNRAGNSTFEVVRARLDEMCCGPRRCMYCEDSCADEIEHFRPKDLYPELVFAWGNYLYACGPCNGPKGHRFAVRVNGHVIDVTRARGAAVVPPTAGEPLLIDPRSEDPLDFMELDLAASFHFSPLTEPGTEAFARAEYTIDLLGLNRREALVRARQGARDHYTALLRAYVDDKIHGAHARILAHRREAIVHRTPQATVWAEVKRQRATLGLTPLFYAAPEALQW